MSVESPNPEEIEEMSEEELEQFKRDQKARLDSAIHEETRELNEKEQAALDILSEDAKDRTDTEAIEIGQATLYVKNEIGGEVERKFDKIADAQTEGNLDDVVDTIIDAILELVVDDDEDGRVDFQSREVWRAIHEKHGTTYLGEVFAEVADPAMSRMEKVQNFRQK